MAPRRLVRCVWLALIVHAAGSCRGDTGPRTDTASDASSTPDATGASAQLVEEFTLEPPNGTGAAAFLMVGPVVPDGRGGVFVFDRGVPALLEFDASGRYVRTIGSEGSGPGEYGDGVTGVALLRDDWLLVDDARNGRILVYDSAGRTIDQWQIPYGLFAPGRMVVDTAGVVYVKISLGRADPNRPLPMGLLRLNRSGVVLDTLSEPRVAGEPDIAAAPFGVQKVWQMSVLGDLVIGLNATYAFEIRSATGPVLTVERSFTPVAVTRGEREQVEAMYERGLMGGMPGGRTLVPDIPRVKPAYSAIDVGSDGQIWIRLHVEAERVQSNDDPAESGDAGEPVWREPAVYDVFQPDGAYTGRVRLPDGVRLAAHRGTEVWGVKSVGLDGQNVVRYRVVFPR